MRLEERPISDVAGTILMHNVADAEGQRTVRKGILLTETDAAQLAELNRPAVLVAVLDEDDVHEDEAALTQASAIQTGKFLRKNVTKRNPPSAPPIIAP